MCSVNRTPRMDVETEPIHFTQDDHHSIQERPTHDLASFWPISEREVARPIDNFQLSTLRVQETSFKWTPLMRLCNDQDLDPTLLQASDLSQARCSCMPSYFLSMWVQSSLNVQMAMSFFRFA